MHDEMLCGTPENVDFPYQNTERPTHKSKLKLYEAWLYSLYQLFRSQYLALGSSGSILQKREHARDL